MKLCYFSDRLRGKEVGVVYHPIGYGHIELMDVVSKPLGFSIFAQLTQEELTQIYRACMKHQDDRKDSA